jgi:hypothetical protein
MSEDKPETPVLEFSKKRNSLQNLNRGPKGNQFAVTHAFYSRQWSEEEKAEREAWKQSILEEKGNPTKAEQALINTASWLNAIINRTFCSIAEGKGAPHSEHLLAVVNSFRLIMCALGLDKRAAKEQSPEEKLRAYMSEKDSK